MMGGKGEGGERERTKKLMQAKLIGKTNSCTPDCWKKICAYREITKIKQGAKEPSFHSRRNRK